MLIVKAEGLFSPYVVFYCIVSLTVIKFICEWSEGPKQYVLYLIYVINFNIGWINKFKKCIFFE